MAEDKVQSIQDLFEADTSAHVIERKVVKMGVTELGTLFGEDVKPEGAKKVSLIPLYIEGEVEGKTIHIPLTRPPAEVDPDVYYPAVKFRVTQTRLDELDYAPIDSWKGFPLNDDGRVVYNRGTPIIEFFFVVLSIESLTEQEECSFVLASSVKTVFIHNGVSYIKGSFILDRKEARETLGSSFSGATRRRIEDDEDVVEI